MNILQVVSSTRTSGAEKHLLLLSERLRLRGHTVTAVCPQGGWLPDRLRETGIPVVELCMRGPLSFSTIFQISRIARRGRIDVMHVHLTRATYIGYFAGFIAGVPVISTVHILSRDFAYRWLPGRNHRFIAVSNHIRRALLDRGLAPHRVQTIYNGSELADAPVLAPASALSVRAELGLPADAQVVGLVGRVDTFKGHDLQVRAARAIVDACPKAYFVFVGHADPALQQALWEMAAQSGVDDRLRFTGIRNDIARMVGAMDVVTLPSLSESFGMAIVEAMAMGKPVVATRAGALVEVIEEGVTGYLVDRDPDAVAGAVVSVLRDPERARTMGEAGSARARSLFSLERMTRDIEDVYRCVVTPRQPAAAL